MEGYIEGNLEGWFTITRKGMSRDLLEVLKNGTKKPGGRGWVLIHNGLGVVARFYRRGGLVGKITKKLLFFERKRPLEELKITYELHSSGFPAPEPLGVFIKKEGIWMEAVIFTRIVSGKGLEDALKEEKRKEILKSLGSTIRDLHSKGVLHGDLNIHNVIVHKERVYLIDFDRAKRVKNLKKRHIKAQILRLIKSMMKEGVYRKGDENAIVQGYGVKLDIKPRKLLWRVGWALGL